jgi:flagellar protein FliO/FliZ
MDQLGLLLRVVLSLTVVLGLMWLAARALRGVAGARGAGVVEVVARQTLGRGSAIAVVRVADKGLVLGVTDGHVTLLGETDLAAIAAVHPARSTERRTPATRTAGADVPGQFGADLAADLAAPAGRLDGSILSPRTWRRAVDALRERTVRS